MSSRALLLALMLSAPACGGGSAPIVTRPDADDADVDAHDDGVPGARSDSKVISYQKPDCLTARTICDDDGNVRTCLANLPSENVSKLCSSSCSLGRCTTPSCAEAERSEGILGCRFYGVQVDNVDADDGRKLMLLVTNNAPIVVHAWVDLPNRDGTWTTVETRTIGPDGGTRIELNRPVPDVGVTVAGGFRVQSDAPVMVVQIVSDDAVRDSTSSGGTVLRPAQSLFRDYTAVTSPARVTDAVSEVTGSRNGAAAITVLALEANTHVTLTLTSSALVGPGTIVGSPPPGVYAAPAMNEGDVLQIFSTAPDGDLTGSNISADVPIAVFSGNIYTTYGFKPSGFNGGDMAEEQLPPTASWGLEYIGARLSPQTKCDPFFGPGVGMWRVVAAGEGADVTISPAPGVSVEGANLVPGFKFHLDGSGSQTFLTRSKQDPPIPTDFVITGSKPILLAQWLDCEPGLSWGIDSRRLSSGDLSFKLPPGFNHEVIVVRETARKVELDGVELLDTRFHTIVPGLVYEIARLDAADLGPCEDAFDDCQHHLVGASWGVTWRGMDVVCSYALTVPSGQSCALPNASCTE